MQHAQSAAAVPNPDAFRVSGTSPTLRAATPQRLHVAVAAEPLAAARVRTYDTIHLLGPGAVGRALLKKLNGDRRRLIAVTDSSATLHDPHGLDAAAVLAWKQAGRALRDHPGALFLPGAAAIGIVDADIVADATSTEFARAEWTASLTGALERGACVAAAAKAALCQAGAEWLSGSHRARVGCNAVLGGTGRSFISELPELQQRTRELAIVGNASTTAIIDVIERGGTLEDGIAEAQLLGYLEPDPELDLRGTDAAVKLAIVAGIVSGRRIDPDDIPCDDIRSLDLPAVRARARRHATTRLVARLAATGDVHVRYEEVSRDCILAVPRGRVVYEYRLTRDERRLHIGSGLGAEATAGALWSDIRGLGAESAALVQLEASQ